jgi:chromosome segregation ATPase
MPATIKVDLQDNSKQWADDLTQRLNQVRTSADDLEGALHDVGAELDPKQVQEYREEAKRLVDVFANLEQQQRDSLDVTKKLTAEQQQASQRLSDLVVETKNAEGATEAFRAAQLSLQKTFANSEAANYANELQQVTGEFGDITAAAKRVDVDGLFDKATKSIKDLEQAAGPAQQRIADLNRELASQAGDSYSKNISKNGRGKLRSLDKNSSFD